MVFSTLRKGVGILTLLALAAAGCPKNTTTIAQPNPIVEQESKVDYARKVLGKNADIRCINGKYMTADARRRLENVAAIAEKIIIPVRTENGGILFEYTVKNGQNRPSPETLALVIEKADFDGDGVVSNAEANAMLEAAAEHYAK